MYRRASTTEEVWYYETIIWEWNPETKKRGRLLKTEDSGSGETRALTSHFELIRDIEGE